MGSTVSRSAIDPPAVHSAESEWEYRAQVFGAPVLFRYAGGEYIEALVFGRAVAALNVWEYAADGGASRVRSPAQLRATCRAWIQTISWAEWWHGYMAAVARCECDECRARKYARSSTKTRQQTEGRKHR
jgi:hypothetical protein